MLPRLTLESFGSQSSGHGRSEGEDIQATPSLGPLLSSSSSGHGDEIMREDKSRMFLLSTPPVIFMGSRGPILPIVLFAEFSSEITAFVVFHLDEAFLFHLTIDLFTRFTTHVSPSSFEFGT